MLIILFYFILKPNIVKQMSLLSTVYIVIVMLCIRIWTTLFHVLLCMHLLFSRLLKFFCLSCVVLIDKFKIQDS